MAQLAEHKLPNGLLLILHLHLLDYPLQDAASRFDEHLFDPKVNLRERVKATEDICHFLVAKIEGRERVKAILPTYPCVQPSDTTAFRISLSKYMEALRQSAMHAGQSSGASSDRKGKQPAATSEDSAAVAAWWWKDVPVRKSTLEECAGEKFERLILALSTQAIFRNALRASSAAIPPSLFGDHEALRGLPSAYGALLLSAQSARIEWERSAAELVHRQATLATLRRHLADPNPVTASKFDSLSTDRLLALRDSRHHDLVRDHWKRDEGARALHLITELAGLSRVDPSTERPQRDVDVPPSARVVQVERGPETPASASRPPLPIAAAHHPTHLRTLAAPLFPDVQCSAEPGPDTGGGEISHAFTERLGFVERQRKALEDALRAAQRTRADLDRRIQSAQKGATDDGPRRPGRNKPASGLNTKLWEPDPIPAVDFKLPSNLDPTLLARFSLSVPPADTEIEDRIAHLRTAALPAYVVEAPPPPPPPAKSRLPQPSTNKGALRPEPRLAVAHRANAHMPPPMVHAPTAHVAGTKAKAAARRMSRRASAAHARTRRSTVFRLDDEISRIVDAVHHHSGSESDDDPAHDFRPGTPRTPFEKQGGRGTAGTPLSAMAKRSVPRPSFNMERYERAMPRLPSLGLDEIPDREDDDLDEDSNDAFGEGYSLTLKDILLQAGHAQGSGLELLNEDEPEDEDESDPDGGWE